jgi:hypothetical protein
MTMESEGFMRTLSAPAPAGLNFVVLFIAKVCVLEQIFLWLLHVFPALQELCPSHYKHRHI